LLSRIATFSLLQELQQLSKDESVIGKQT